MRAVPGGMLNVRDATVIVVEIRATDPEHLCYALASSRFVATLRVVDPLLERTVRSASQFGKCWRSS